MDDEENEAVDGTDAPKDASTPVEQPPLDVASDDGEEADDGEGVDAHEGVDAVEEADAGEGADDGEDVEQTPSPPTPRRPLWMRVGQLLLAPLLVCGAVGVHWWLNVPDKILKSPQDQGAKKPKKNKKDKKARRKSGRTREDRRREQSRNDARSPEQLEQDWKRYGEVPFEDEPTQPVWARRHQALINRAVVVARHQAFEGAPEQPRVVLTETKCRTVRCRFILRSPYRHELDVITDSLARLQSNEHKVWRSYEMVPVEAPEDGAAKDDEEHRIQITVAFASDETDTRSLTIRSHVELDADVTASAGTEADTKAPR